MLLQQTTDNARTLLIAGRNKLGFSAARLLQLSFLLRVPSSLVQCLDTGSTGPQHVHESMSTSSDFPSILECPRCPRCPSCPRCHRCRPMLLLLSPTLTHSDCESFSSCARFEPLARGDAAKIWNPERESFESHFTPISECPGYPNLVSLETSVSSSRSLICCAYRTICRMVLSSMPNTKQVAKSTALVANDEAGHLTHTLFI